MDAEEDTSKKTGADMIKLTLAIIEDGKRGPKLFDYLVFTQGAAFRGDQFLVACGAHPGEGEDYEWDAEKLIGMKCRATLKVEKYDGKESNKVAAYLEPSEF